MVCKIHFKIIPSEVKIFLASHGKYSENISAFMSGNPKFQVIGGSRAWPRAAPGLKLRWVNLKLCPTRIVEISVHQPHLWRLTPYFTHVYGLLVALAPTSTSSTHIFTKLTISRLVLHQSTFFWLLLSTEKWVSDLKNLRDCKVLKKFLSYTFRNHIFSENVK